MTKLVRPLCKFSRAFWIRRSVPVDTPEGASSARDKQQVRIANSAQAVSDAETGATPEQVLQSFLDQALGAGVHTGGGLVQDQDAWVRQGSSSDCQQLALPLAQ